MNYQLLEECLDKIKDYDDKWIIRKRKINTQLIFKCLINSAFTDIGVSSCLRGLESNFSHTAMIKARQKLGDDFFKDINTSLNTNKSNRIYAIDGSKIRVHAGFKKFGYKTRTNDKPVPREAKRPLAMLSSLYNVESQSTVNYTITKHFNERKCVPELINVLQKEDIVIMDRGYYSASLFEHFHETKVHAVFRLKKNANKTVKKFYSSSKTDLNTNIIYNEKFIPIRYVKYTINRVKYVIGTTITNMSSRVIKQLYKLRWGIETSYKRIKSFHNINKIYARTQKLWLQEVQLRILYDTLLIKTQNNTAVKKRKKVYKIPYGVINMKIYLVIENIPFLHNINFDNG